MIYSIRLFAAPLLALAALALAPAESGAQDRLDYYAVPDAKCDGHYRYGKYYESCAYDAQLDKNRYGSGASPSGHGKPHGRPHRPPPPQTLVIADPNHVLVEPGGTQSLGAFGDLQAAIAYAVDGGRVVIKPGAYYLDRPLDIDKSLTIEGMGPYGSVIIQPRGAACLSFNPPTRTNAPALFITNVRFAPRGGTATPQPRAIIPARLDGGGPQGFVSGGRMASSPYQQTAPATDPCIDIRQGFVRLENVEMDLRLSQGGALRLIDGDLEVEDSVIVGPVENGYVDAQSVTARPSEIIERAPCDWGGYGICTEGGDASIRGSEVAGFPVGLRLKSSSVVEDAEIHRNGVGVDIAQTGDRFADTPGIVLLDTAIRLNDVGLMVRSNYAGDFRATNYLISDNRVAGLYLGARPTGRCDFSADTPISYNGARNGLLWSDSELASWARAQDRSYARPYGTVDVWTTQAAAYSCRVLTY